MGFASPECDVKFLQVMLIISIHLFSLANIISNLANSILDLKVNFQLNGLIWYPRNLTRLARTKFLSGSCFWRLFPSNDFAVEALATIYGAIESNEKQKITVFRA